MRLFVKKHYIKVAEILRETDPDNKENQDFMESFTEHYGKEKQHNRIIREFSQAFQADCYDKFDLNKFQKACYKK